jgi:hypothetical protein
VCCINCMLCMKQSIRFAELGQRLHVMTYISFRYKMICFRNLHHFPEEMICFRAYKILKLRSLNHVSIQGQFLYKHLSLLPEIQLPARGQRLHCAHCLPHRARRCGRQEEVSGQQRSAHHQRCSGAAVLRPSASASLSSFPHRG